jgi:hypothetical protein
LKNHLLTPQLFASLYEMRTAAALLLGSCVGKCRLHFRYNATKYWLQIGTHLIESGA